MEIPEGQAESVVQLYRKLLAAKGYTFYEMMFKLNIIGIRSGEETAGAFDDTLLAMYLDTPAVRDGSDTLEARWRVFQYEITTDPGIPYLRKPIGRNTKGQPAAAILKEGQYRDAYAIGLHRGSYKALCQVGRVTVYRDKNRDSHLDFVDPHSGFFGINIHKRKGRTDMVGGASAGCQVFRYDDEFDELMMLAYAQLEHHGNKFTYTLLSQSDVDAVLEAQHDAMYEQALKAASEAAGVVQEAFTETWT